MGLAHRLLKELIIAPTNAYRRGKEFVIYKGALMAYDHERHFGPLDAEEAEKQRKSRQMVNRLERIESKLNCLESIFFYLGSR